MSVAASGVKAVRVLEVCTILLTARVFIAPVARYLSVRGYEVAIGCSTANASDGPRSPTMTELKGFSVHHIDIPRTIRPFKDLCACWALYRLIKQFRPTIVHTQTSKAGMIGRFAAYLAGTPIIIHTAHAFPFHVNLHPVMRWVYVLLERWAGRVSDLIMVDTVSVKNEGGRAGVMRDPSHLAVVPMGIDLNKFSPTGREPATLRRTFAWEPQDLVVGTVARLVPDKGLECFLQMAALVHAARPSTRFLIVGDGPLRADLERQAIALNVHSRVLFAGHRADIPDLMAVLDVFVLPTLREGFGVVFAEAMAMEKPTVGSRIGPVSEVIEEGVTGHLATPGRPQEFAQYVLQLLEDQSKRRRFGEAGRRRVEQLFSQSRMCELIEGHYRRLLAQKGFVP